ncbi:DUF2007 domain-containing protein [Ectothiorhodospira variabilis]|uniref:putative signal transducing protein n=1 Tax=Ectothiorhodospira variabilis TaxID=505694 RepID=UPI001EFADE68|nr:DUF2007 domain-containing protein [Ectothiorhodospira variabilis]MCG5495445.1 DUF2007 domain-containing protein [Ectothiorhodospira variabilis]MCG5505043.1 DUF2007 domain-containing protein [Ectothiorhodospira variabilis]MCG5508200.1 DUF2007 domain-containing protein [Ectothiorhodospira variabilis]
MKRVYSAADVAAAGFIQGVLESEGIRAYVKHALLCGAAGELPPTECWPEIWVMEDDDEARALEIIDAVTMTVTDSENWTCQRCSEPMEAQFTQCWNCGAQRPDREWPSSPPPGKDPGSLKG